MEFEKCSTLRQITTCCFKFNYFFLFFFFFFFFFFPFQKMLREKIEQMKKAHDAKQKEFSEKLDHLSAQKNKFEKVNNKRKNENKIYEF